MLHIQGALCTEDGSNVAGFDCIAQNRRYLDQDRPGRFCTLESRMKKKSLPMLRLLTGALLQIEASNQSRHDLKRGIRVKLKNNLFEIAKILSVYLRLRP